MKSRQLGHLGIGADTGDPGLQLLDFLQFRGQRFALRSDALALLLSKRMANTPTELQYLGRWCPRILSGRDHPYRQDFHAPTQLLPQTI